MKVKCIKTFINPPNREIINSDMRGFIEINTIFIVYGIRLTTSTTYFYIFNGNHLIEVPMHLFELIDDEVPSGLIYQMSGDGSSTLWPRIFYQKYFLENFSEYETEEREIFDKLRKEMDY